MKTKTILNDNELLPKEPTYDEQLAARTGAKLFVRSRPFNPHVVTGSESFEEFLSSTASQIQQAEGRTRRRSPEANDAFIAALRAVILDLFAAWMVDPELQVGVNLRTYGAKEQTRYCNAQLTFRQFRSAFAGLLRLGYLQIDKNGWHDRNSGDGHNTKITATQALIDALRD